MAHDLLNSVAPSEQTHPRFVSASNRGGRLGLWPLIAATFFMVSGGAYGTEDIIHGAGYGRGILVLLLMPLLCSLPTAFMVGELASALPAEGGFYAWVRRALGNFWGFQEAWLSLIASIFDMAIYPTLAVAYLTRLVPWVGIGRRGILVGVALIIVSAIFNLAGVRIVGFTSLWIFVVLAAPFAAIVLLLIVAAVRSESEQVLGMNALAFAGFVTLAGFAAYGVMWFSRTKSFTPSRPVMAAGDEKAAGRIQGDA